MAAYQSRIESHRVGVTRLGPMDRAATVSNIEYSVAYAMRYSKGGISYEAAMRMDGRRFGRMVRALGDVLTREAEVAKKKG